jgi:hypothetical protein
MRWLFLGRWVSRACPSVFGCYLFLAMLGVLALLIWFIVVALQ